jgi:hypothetical protein
VSRIAPADAARQSAAFGIVVMIDPKQLERKPTALGSHRTRVLRREHCALFYLTNEQQRLETPDAGPQATNASRKLREEQL